MRPAVLATLIAALVMSVTAASCSSGAQARQVPRGFMGVLTGGPIGDPDQRAITDREVKAMASSGVESLRTAFYWRDAQPESAAATDFTAYDRIVGTAARNGIDVLPTVLGTPRWARHTRDEVSSRPARPEDYARFMAALVDRYGPNGSFWAQHTDIPKRPIRVWQLWNEPDHIGAWSEQPYYKAYVALLKAARPAIRERDPGAKIALAGLVGKSWLQLAAIYRAGGGGQFDYLAVHPFTRMLSDVVRILRYNHQVAARNHDGAKPMIVTELTWPSSEHRVHPPSAFDRSERTQATLLTAAFRALAKRRTEFHIRSVYWASWLSRDRSRTDAFDYTGLSVLRLNGSVKRKPAYFAYRRVARALEGPR